MSIFWCFVKNVILAVVLISNTACFTANTKQGGLGPKGQQVIISLTYDDALPIHYQLVAPLLQKHGMHGTFYLTIKDIDDAHKWQTVAAKGHELGNHSLFHPCRREPPQNYTWLPEHYDLAGYNLERFRDELKVTNQFIDLLDGGRQRTYGNTCLNLFVGKDREKKSIKPVVDELFLAARGNITNKAILPDNVDYAQLGHFSGDGKSFDEIRAEIELASASGGWLIFMFHGVGEGTHGLFIDAVEHEKLINWLSQSKSRYWVAPVAEVVKKWSIGKGISQTKN